MLTRNSLIFKGLWGVATGLSWIFYFRALQLGKVSPQVALVIKLSIVITIALSATFLGEKFTWHTGLGAVLIIGGTPVLIF